jgi:hypothetical protein
LYPLLSCDSWRFSICGGGKGGFWNYKLPSADGFIYYMVTFGGYGCSTVAGMPIFCSKICSALFAMLLELSASDFCYEMEERLFRAPGTTPPMLPLWPCLRSGGRRDAEEWEICFIGMPEIPPNVLLGCY